MWTNTITADRPARWSQPNPQDRVSREEFLVSPELRWHSDSVAPREFLAMWRTQAVIDPNLMLGREI